jgi:TPR repeat protein
MNRPNRYPLLPLCGLIFYLCAGAAASDPERDYQRGFKAYAQEDLIGAMEALGQAADAGHPKAQALLGYIFDKAEQDAEAMRYYRLAADQGDPAGEYGVATLYAAGEGVEKDDAEALRWFSMAAEKGHGPAIDVLADAYLQGALGLEPDREEALRLLRMGAAEGYEPARRKLLSLEAGEGGK